MDTRIYTITHKPFQLHEQADQQIYLPLHVGRVLGEDLGYMGDDTGDNISRKNKTYCELTGLYWIWKNVICDIVGIAHYRRFLIDGDRNEILDRERIEEGLAEYDILLSAGCYTSEKNIMENYEKWHRIDDLAICRQVVKELFYDDLDAFDLAMNSNLFSGGNLFVTSKGIFDEYCCWLFTILDEVEARTDTGKYDEYQKRLYGFLAERLIRVFVLARAYRIKEFRVGQIG